MSLWIAARGIESALDGATKSLGFSQFFLKYKDFVLGFLLVIMTFQGPALRASWLMTQGPARVTNSNLANPRAYPWYHVQELSTASPGFQLSKDLPVSGGVTWQMLCDTSQHRPSTLLSRTQSRICSLSTTPAQTSGSSSPPTWPQVRHPTSLDRSTRQFRSSCPSKVLLTQLSHHTSVGMRLPTLWMPGSIKALGKYHLNTQSNLSLSSETRQLGLVSSQQLACYIHPWRFPPTHLMAGRHEPHLIYILAGYLLDICLHEI